MHAHEQRFRRLAMSSPWRWSTLAFRFEQWSPSDAGDVQRGQAWIRRADAALRVETDDGHVMADRHPGPLYGRRFHADGTSDRYRVFRPGEPDAPTPTVDDEGLVVQRPADLAYDDPMYGNYRWVAMLDPVELGAGHTESPGSDVSPVDVEHVEDLLHRGRPSVEAVLRPTEAYRPRCECCPLLAVRERLEAYWTAFPLPRRPGAGDGTPAPVIDCATRWVVRLDLETAVCVHVEELDGPRRTILTLAIERVNEPLPDELFSTE